mgnify:CR=1 FL=1
MIHESIWLPVTGALAGWLMGTALNRLVQGFLVAHHGIDAFPPAGGAKKENFLNFRSLLLFGALPAVTAFLTTWRTWSPELLDALGDHLVEIKFDLRRLMRSIMRSRVYQLSSTSLPENADDRRFYPHYNINR